MSEPGPDFTGEIAAALAVPGLAGVPNLPGVTLAASYPEYRVTSPGDSTPTSGASLADVTGAADRVDEAGAAPDAAVEPPVNPVDVSTLGGAVNQWWVSPEDAIATQAVADQVNAAQAGAAVPGSDGVDTGWQPFPPGPDGMIPQ